MERFNLDKLEPRRLLAAVTPPVLLRDPLAEPTIRVRTRDSGLQPQGSVGPVGYTPAQLRHAYGFDNLVVGNGVLADGAGQTVVIIDAFDNPKFVSSTDPNYNTSDLYLFNAAFGLPQFGLPGGPTFTKVNQTGGTSYPAGNTGWGTEIALDVEWVHALAPGANIILVEATDNSLSNMITASVGWAKTQPGVSVVSMSFGTSEFFGETGWDSNFTTPSGHNGITYLAASGDNGKPGIYPAYSPNVVAVGGTSLTLSGNNYVSETGWSGSGGGISSNLGREPKPSYQSSITLSNNRRMIPDVSIVADPNTGVPVYDSFSQGSGAPWLQVGGTSLSAPLWGSIIAITDQVRGIAGLGTLHGRNDTLPGLYSMSSSNFHDITSGNNGFSALVGYDLVTGRGTPKVDQIVNDFVGAAPGTPDLPTIYDSGTNTADNLTRLGTVHFTGSATSGLIVQIVSDGTVVGSGTASGGSYDIAVSGLGDGQHVITARVGARASAGISVTIDTIAPSVSNFTFNFDTGHSMALSLSEGAVAGLSIGSVTVSPTEGGDPIGVTGFSYTGAGPAVFTLPISMPDGNYTATVAATLGDTAGNSALTNVDFDFFVLAGDADHNRIVDSNDLLALASHWQMTGVTFSQGDFNYDGTVDSADLSFVAARWQFILSPPAASPTLAAALVGAPRRAPSRAVTLIV